MYFMGILKKLIRKSFKIYYKENLKVVELEEKFRFSVF